MPHPERRLVAGSRLCLSHPPAVVALTTSLEAANLLGFFSFAMAVKRSDSATEYEGRAAEVVGSAADAAGDAGMVGEAGRRVNGGASVVVAVDVADASAAAVRSSGRVANAGKGMDSGRVRCEVNSIAVEAVLAAPSTRLAAWRTAWGLNWN